MVLLCPLVQGVSNAELERSDRVPSATAEDAVAPWADQAGQNDQGDAKQDLPLQKLDDPDNGEDDGDDDPDLGRHVPASPDIDATQCAPRAVAGVAQRALLRATLPLIVAHMLHRPAEREMRPCGRIRGQVVALELLLQIRPSERTRQGWTGGFE